MTEQHEQHIIKDYIDKQGVPRRVVVPDEYTAPEKGIRISIYLDERLRENGWNKEQIKRLYQELWKRGLIEARDFKPHTTQLQLAALNAVLRMDVQTLQAIVQEQKHNG